MSLFDLGILQEIERGDEKKKTLRVSTCESCGLSASCHTPKAGYTGQGKKKILLITGAMTSHEDKEENRLRSSMFHFLRRAMKEYANIDIEEDCWHTHAIRCYSREHTRDDNYTNATFSACHRMLMNEIEELKPSIIVPLNSKAWQVLLWGRMVGRASHDSFYDYAGEVIPDQVLKTWIAPVYDPEIVKIQDEKQINKFRLFWGQQFNRILVYANKPVPTADISGIRIAHTPEQALELLRDVETWKAFAFDYEATGLKPHKDWHHITHISFSNGKEAYGMPYFEKNRDFIKQICKILTNSAIKVAHNASYERSWSLNIEGIEVNNLCHDPMLGQHSLHNQKPANLKFLGYSRYGILGYDAAVDEFMKASTEDEKKWRCNAKNNMEHAPISKTSTYCAEDSLITFWLYQDIILRDLDKRNQYPGYAFFMEAQKALDAAHERGMVVDMEYLDKVQPELEQRMQAVYMRIMDNPLITRRWDWKTFKPSSDAHVRHLIYDILKCEPFEFTESNLPSVDIDTLYTFVKDCDLIPDLLEYRKLGKIINTYFGQFRGEEVNGLIRPYFKLHGVKTFRSASSQPNFQNISKRDTEAKKIIRSGLKTIPGHRIIEYDFKSMEVSIAAAVSGDPMLIKYVTDLSTDMHYDCAMDLFFLPRDKIAKPLRNDATKGPFVFAEFYGSYWKQVAKGVWDEINIPDAEKKFSLDIMKHLYNNGVKTYEDWEEHVKEQERILWEERFPIYKAFREKTYDSFCKNGFINYPNGFRYYGPASKNEVLNAPVQGPAFHIQLWAFTQVTEELKKRKMKSYLFGQIHDAMVASVAPEEEDWMDYLIWDYATQKVREHWNWITVPLMVEKERSKIITKTEGSWADMEACGFVKGV